MDHGLVEMTTALFFTGTGAASNQESSKMEKIGARTSTINPFDVPVIGLMTDSSMSREIGSGENKGQGDRIRMMRSISSRPPVWAGKRLGS